MCWQVLEIVLSFLPDGCIGTIARVERDRVVIIYKAYLLQLLSAGQRLALPKAIR
jgi:hypothetical protein